MKEVISLIHELKSKGLKIDLDEEGVNLKVKGNTSLLSDDNKKSLVALKPHIIRFLADKKHQRVEHTAIPIAHIAEDYPVSSSQQRLWVLSQFEISNVAYSMPTALELEGEIDMELLKLALFQMIGRYEILRTTFHVNESGEVRQRIQSLEDYEYEIDFHDLQSAQNPDELLQQQLKKAELTPFDLAKGPLFHIALFQIATHKQVLLVNMHHIISDGTSLEMFLEELLGRYGALSKGSDLNLPKLNIQYKDYAGWQRTQLDSSRLTEHRAYWLEQLGGRLPVLSLPSAHKRPKVMTFNGSSVHGYLSHEVTQRLKSLVQSQGATVFMGLLAGMNALFYRYTGDEEMVIGTPVSGREHVDLEDQLGVFLNMLVLRTSFKGSQSFTDLLLHVKQITLKAYKHQVYPFDQLVSELDLDRDTSRSALFDVMLVMHINRHQPENTDLNGLSVRNYPIDQAYSKFDYTFNFTDRNDRIELALEYNTDIYDRTQATSMVNHFVQLMTSVLTESDVPLADIDYLSQGEKHLLVNEFNKTEFAYDPNESLIDRISKQVQRTPDATALVFGDQSLTYLQLSEKSDALAHYLVSQGLGKGDLIGIYLDRSLEMMVGLLAILKSGAAYVPLDPSYPEARIAYIIQDAGIRTVITQPEQSGKLSGFGVTPIFPDQGIGISQPYTVDIRSEDLAYVIYTSGSTGTPKGVKVTHGNVANFLVGMNGAIGSGTQKYIWLAMTSISFDISVLELFWTLSNGVKVVIAPTRSKLARAKDSVASRPMDFSLFYFASEVDYANKYKLLIEGAKFADSHGFSAIWTPERHFHEFGGVYPNPAVTGAAIATITKNIGIRSGSCVLPLHNPIRVAEEWSVVDNLSQGRVGLSFASGWVMNDFLAFSPEGFDTRHDTLYKGMEQVKALWEGQSITLSNSNGEDGEVEIFPKPIQKKLPVWLTAANNPETFRSAGEMGANLLTHLLGQTIDELAEKIKIYRQAWKEAGHEGEGYVTLMIHTFVGSDMAEVKAKVKAPFTNYLRHATGLVRTLARSLGQDPSAESFTSEDMDALLEHAFDRYYDTAALFGTPDFCLTMVNRLSNIGVDELGCLVDFGLDIQNALDGFNHLFDLKKLYESQLRSELEADPARLIKKHDITHMQCTPSALKMILQEDMAGDALMSLSQLLVGGEPLNISLKKRLQEFTPAAIFNMYGPTETTVWSSVAPVSDANRITVGRPIANTQIYLLDSYMHLVPIGVEGEVYIGGHGVTAGYLNRPELTKERFVHDPFSSSGFLYKTGDTGKWISDGQIVLQGRKDDQVKIRGHRIELGEIEATLKKNLAIKDATLKTLVSKDGDQSLAAYLVSDVELDVSAIRTEVAKVLPDYMVPSWILQMDSLPMTPNGKVDKRALPEMEDMTITSQVTYVAPRNDLEIQLTSLWSEVLERKPESIGVLDNFFDLGGHSLNAVKLIGMIKMHLAVKIDLQVLFYMPTIEELAYEIEMVQWANKETGVLEEDQKRAKVRI